MSCKRVYNLADCTEFRQTLLAHPPRFVRGTIVLLIVLVAAALVWTALTEADLVVRAPGRIRPMTPTSSLPEAAAEESQISPLRGGRVREVHVREGDRVNQGDLLLRLDVERLENDLAKQRRRIETLAAELQRIDEKETLLQQSFETARTKAEAELAQARSEIDTAVLRRDAEIRLADVALDAATTRRQRLKALAEKQVASESQLAEAESQFATARLRLEQAQLPVDDGKVLVLRQTLELVVREHAVERTELQSGRERTRGELEAAELELANLQWERNQSELRAPSDGTVTSLNVSVGSVVESGQPVAAVADQCGFRMDLAVTSEDVGLLLREGLPVRIKIDAYDYQKYGSLTGRVIFVAPDSDLEEEADDGQAPTYQVKISLDGEELIRSNRRGRIKLGMTGTAEIVTDRESLLSLLVRSIRQSVSLG